MQILMQQNLNMLCCTVLEIPGPMLTPQKSVHGGCVYLWGCMCAHTCTWYRIVLIVFVTPISQINFWKILFLPAVVTSGGICPSLDAQASFTASGGQYSQFCFRMCRWYWMGNKHPMFCISSFIKWLWELGIYVTPQLYIAMWFN